MHLFYNGFRFHFLLNVLLKMIVFTNKGHKSALSCSCYQQRVYGSMGYAQAILKHHGSPRPGRKELAI
jgi:hypothetical protein